MIMTSKEYTDNHTDDLWLSVGYWQFGGRDPGLNENHACRCYSSIALNRNVTRVVSLCCALS